jgi:hypothetical protein
MDLGHNLEFGKFEELKNMYVCSEVKFKLLHVNLIGFFWNYLLVLFVFWRSFDNKELHIFDIVMEGASLICWVDRYNSIFYEGCGSKWNIHSLNLCLTK